LPLMPTRQPTRIKFEIDIGGLKKQIDLIYVRLGEMSNR